MSSTTETTVDLEVGGAHDEIIPAKAEKQPSPQNEEPLVFRIISCTKQYATFLKIAQYLSCVCLALTLFVEEFFQSGAFLAEQIVYYVSVAAPALLVHTPLYVGFIKSLPSSVREIVWLRFKKQLLLEGVVLLYLVAMIPVAIYLSCKKQKEFGWAVSLPTSTVSVIFYFFSFTSFRHYKNEILQDKKQVCRKYETYEDTKEWAQCLIQHGQEEEQNNTRGAYRVFLRLVARFPVSSAVAWISTILYTACLPIQGLTIGYITQAIAEATPESSFWELFQPALYFLLASAGMAVFLWTMKLGFAAFGTLVEEYFRLQMTRSVCSVGPGKKTTAALLDSGDLSSRYSRDLALISNFIDKNKLFTSSGILLSSFVVLFTVDWRMGFFFVISCPALIMTLVEKPGAAHKAGTVAAARLQSRFENCVELRRTMDLYNAGDYVYKKSAKSMEEDIQKIGHSKWVAGHFVSMVHATGLAYTALISLAFILFSIPLARTNPAKAVNHLSAALVILSQLKSPFSQIGQGVEHWLSIAPALCRLDQFCHETEINNDDNGGDSSTQWSEYGSSFLSSSVSSLTKNSLELRNVHFRYSENAPDVLFGVNAKLETGQYTCIVGGSGAGKSTLLNILTRELAQTQGNILLDGQRLAGRENGKSTSTYRKQIAIVFQNSTFLDGTIADNIRLGMPTATDEEVAIAAQRAQCTFLKDLPKGLDTQLGGPGGMNLSGGQGQRVCVARALVRNPKLLILDEATSALDPHTEQEAVKSFVNLAHKENVAVVSVTHRLDTTESSDKVIVLKDGVVAEEGSPADLYERKGLFYDMRRTKNNNSISNDSL